MVEQQGESVIIMEEPKYIENFSTEELEAELQHRKAIKPSALPLYSVNFPSVDYADLYNYTVSLVDGLDAGEGLPDDYEQSLVEKAVETVYGNDIWKWWRSKV